MANVIRNMTNGSLKIKDGTTPTPLEITIPVMEGDFSWTETDEARTVMNRGTLHSFANPLEEPMTVSFTVKFCEYRGNTNTNVPSPVDALKQRGEAAAWVSTTGCGPYTTDLEFTITKPSPCTDANEQSEVLDFPQFHADTITFEEGEDFNTITVEGKCLATKPTSTRT